MLTHPFGLTADGAVIHVDQADNDQGPYACAGCGDRMSLVRESRPYQRRGSEREIRRRAYFRHAHRDDCATGLETSLHLWAKTVIQEAMTIGLPTYRVAYKDMSRGFDTPWTYHAVELEPWQDGIRPDLVLHHGAGRLNVEILVHHEVDDHKAEILRRRHASCIEIDLSPYDFETTPADELRQAILHGAGRRWISHQLQEEWMEVLRDEWRAQLPALVTSLGARLDDYGPPVGPAAHSIHQSQSTRLGTAPFIGRDVPGSHWFAAPPEIWQHEILKICLTYRSGSTLTDFRLDDGSSEHEHIMRYPYQKEQLRIDEDPDVVEALGMTIDDYGSPLQTINAYLRMLADEPDIENVHPVARRLISFGDDRSHIVVQPLWRDYIRRRDYEMRMAFEGTVRPKQKDAPHYHVWLKRPLGRGPTPRKLCLDEGVEYHRTIARLKAIRNMLNGGWPVDDLMDVAEGWLRDRRKAAYYAPYDQDGGVQPFNFDAYRYCDSTEMLRERRPVEEILVRMAAELHEDGKAATDFLWTIRDDLGGYDPKTFVVDVPTLQYCIDLMPRPAGPGSGKQRLW